MQHNARRRALLLQHAIYPYRRPVFEELNRWLELTVLFCLRAESFRGWDTAPMLEDVPFRARVLSHLRLGKLVFNPRFLAELRRGRYDVFLIGTIDFITFPQVLVLLAVAKVRGLPVVVCEEFFPTEWFLRQRPIVTRIAILMRRLVYGRCDAFVAWNTKARTFLLSCGVPEERIFSGPHYYPEPEHQTAEEVPDRCGGRPVVLAISYLLKRKGLDVLIRAFRRLPHDAVLVIGGSGEQEATLREAAAGDDRIHFVGYLDEPAKQAYLDQAYVFVLPTLWDSWGVVVNEAMYHRLPVLVTDAAGCSDDLVEGNGFVVPAGDEDALLESLRLLLDDPEMRDAMAARSRELVEACSLEAMVEPVRQAVALVTGAAPSRKPGEPATTAPTPGS